MTEMDIDDVRTFVAVVEGGSVSRAAHDLHLTQPAVTRRLQRFEEAVGAALLDRRRRPFTLTDVGRAAVERCRRLLTTAQELRSLNGGTEVSREARIGVAHALTELALSDPVDQVRRSFPRVVLRLHTGWSRDLLERVRSAALDAAVILLPEGERLPAGLAGHILGKERLVVVASRRSRVRVRRMADLRDAGWVLSPEGCAARAALRKTLGAAGLPLPVNVETYNYELQLALIARERGLGLVPSRLLARSRMRSRVRALRVRGLRFPQLVWMVTGELAPGLEPPVRALAEVLGNRFRGGRALRGERGEPS